MKRITILIGLLAIFSCTTPPIVGCKYSPVQIAPTDQLTILINQVRVDNGLQPLIPESLLTSLSKQKVDQMIGDGFISHNGFADLATNSQYVLQNVGYGYQTDIGFFTAYMASPKHRSAILDPKVTHIGSYTSNLYNCIIFAKY